MSAVTTCKVFEMTSTGGTMEFQPIRLGTYELQNFFINERVVYKNMEADKNMDKNMEAYLFSIQHENEEFDGYWLV